MSVTCNFSRLRRRKRDGIWEFEYSTRPGEWKEKSTGSRNKKDAKAFLTKFRRKVEDDELPNEMGEWTLSQTIDHWLELRRPPTKAPRTWKAERSRLRAVLKLIGDVKLESVGLPDFERYQACRLKNGIAEWCVNKELYLLRMLLDRANLWNGQLARLYKPLSTKTSDIGRALSREELEHLVKTALQNEDWRATMYGSVLAANTGLRGEEVRQLKLGVLDLTRRELQVLRATAKNDSGARNIPLNKDAFAAAMCLYQRALRLGANRPEHYLLPACLSRHTKSFDPLNGGRGYTPTRNQQSWRSSWESLTKAAGLPGFNFHSLRHTFITHMVEEGVSLEHIQTMVGHLSAKMVRHYTHIATRVLHKDVAVLDQKPVLAHLIQAPTLLEMPTVAPATGAIQ